MTMTDTSSPTHPSPGPGQPKLQVTNLSRTFTRSSLLGRSTQIEALKDVNLSIAEGEFVCLLGASGCGKSTLLSIIAGLDQPTSGAVYIEGERVVGPGADRGVVFQGYSLYPWKSVAQNIAFGLEIGNWSKSKRNERVEEMLGVMGLTDFADAQPHELSGGMRQRVAIARALAPEPDMLLFDEPFGALDAQTKANMHDFVLSLWQRTSTTILMVTHDIEEAVYLANRIYVMAPRPGRIAEEVRVPFGSDRGPLTKRDPRFMDLRDELTELVAH